MTRGNSHYKWECNTNDDYQIKYETDIYWKFREQILIVDIKWAGQSNGLVEEHYKWKIE